jgi:hypothetical protein
VHFEEIWFDAAHGVTGGEMEFEKSMKVNAESVTEEKPTKRILCIGKIRKGKKTMIIAFPQKGGNEHVTVSPCREDGK